MLYVERAPDGRIIALHDAPTPAAAEQRGVMDEEVLAFLNRNGTDDTWKQLLSATDTGTIRVVEDLIDILIRKNVITFTELPDQAQQRIRDRKQLRDRIVSQELLVDDIL
jgi:hypothetical protein